MVDIDVERFPGMFSLFAAARNDQKQLHQLMTFWKVSISTLVMALFIYNGRII